MQANMSKGYKGLGMEGRIATWYAKNTAMDLAEFRGVAARRARTFGPGSRILEVPPGPGYLSIELAKLGNYQMTALDISNTFVEIANENARKASVKINFQQGNASAMH